MLAFRVRLLLRMEGSATLHASHAGVLYALLSAAFGEGASTRAALPDGLLLDAPEQCRTRLEAGEAYAFGFTLMAEGGASAAESLDALLRGLGRIAKAKPQKGTPFRGNFRLTRSEDLVRGVTRTAGEPLHPIALSHLSEEVRRASALPEITLRFHSPLRMRRPEGRRKAGHGHFDGDCFVPQSFLSRVRGRVRDLDFLPLGSTPPDVAQDSLELIENRLVWLDVSYGTRTERKSLGGSMGRVVLRVRDQAALSWIVAGQYLRAGHSTRFGMGAYRIEELGPDPWPCPRAIDLLELALRSPALDRAAEQVGLESGRLKAASLRLREGRYAPAPPMRIDLPKPDGSVRALMIPPRLDRALQRLIHDQIAPGLDRFFEDSSLAFRRGLGRDRAARRLARLFRDGFHWAVRSDFERFFDSIDHDTLRARLEAYLSDDALVSSLMLWVGAGAPAPGKGLPTGAPLSPLLANLFLDRFDEEVEREGGRLVRYADDFLVLARTQEEAGARFDVARATADALLLRLNEEKTASVDLKEPFEFLGYRFERAEKWVSGGPRGPKRVEDLGWREARGPRPRDPAESTGELSLPGEEEGPYATRRSSVIVGPGAVALDIERDELVCTYPGGRQSRVGRSEVGEVVALGPPSLSGRLLEWLLSRDVPLYLSDESGRVTGVVAGSTAAEDADAVRAQVAAAESEARRLAVGRALVAAKLSNYAALADAAPSRSAANDREMETGARLRQLADRVGQATSLNALMGLEGSGAALWYHSLGDRLPKKFPFERRVAPDAEDPVNVLLNIAQSALHRVCLLALQAAGLSPALGLYHTPRGTHFALASDIQEVFRHLADRVVMEACRGMGPQEFRRTRDGPFKLSIQWQASRRFAAHLHRTLSRPCKGEGQSEAVSYREQIWWQARALRRHLLAAAAPGSEDGTPVQLETFVHARSPVPARPDSAE